MFGWLFLPEHSYSTFYSENGRRTREEKWAHCCCSVKCALHAASFAPSKINQPPPLKNFCYLITANGKYVTAVQLWLSELRCILQLSYSKSLSCIKSKWECWRTTPVKWDGHVCSMESLLSDMEIKLQGLRDDPTLANTVSTVSICLEQHITLFLFTI